MNGIRAFTSLAAVFLASLPVCSTYEPVPIDVPSGGDVTIDGKWSEHEWEAAVSAGVGDLEVALLMADDFLQVGVLTSPIFVASICVERGDEVHVFHASAAVGHAIYTRKSPDGPWSLSQNFEWRLRQKDIPISQSERMEHRSIHGWVANTFQMEPASGTAEFQISSDYLTGEPIRMALGLLMRDPVGVKGWPIGPDADPCTTREVVGGPLPEQASFDTSDWAELSIHSRE